MAVVNGPYSLIFRYPFGRETVVTFPDKPWLVVLWHLRRRLWEAAVGTCGVMIDGTVEHSGGEHRIIARWLRQDDGLASFGENATDTEQTFAKNSDKAKAFDGLSEDEIASVNELANVIVSNDHLPIGSA